MERRLDNWLEAYTAYAAGTSAPPHAHYWVGVAQISRMLAHNVWYEREFDRLFPSMYVAIAGPENVVGPSSVFTPLTPLYDHLPDFRLFQAPFTRHSLMQQAKAAAVEVEVAPGQYETQYPVHGMFSEAADLERFRTANHLRTLSEIWDSQGISRTRHKSTITPAFSFLATFRIDWLRAEMPKDMTDSGFLSTVAIVYARNAVPANPQIISRAERSMRVQSLLDDLWAIRKLRGPIHMEPPAKVEARRMQDRAESVIVAAPTGTVRPSRTIVAMTMKIAMILAAARGSADGQTLVVTNECLKEAQEHMAYLERARNEVLRYVGNGKVARVAARLIWALEVKGEMKVADLLKISAASPAEVSMFKAALKDCIDAAAVSCRQEPDGMRVRLSDKSATISPY